MVMMKKYDSDGNTATVKLKKGTKETLKVVDINGTIFENST